MISKKIDEAINRQIANEGYASSSYLSMASWCEAEGLRGCAAFFYEQSSEEREHMLKLVKYVNQTGGHARITDIKAPPAVYKSVTQVFEMALDQELGVTKDINKLVEFALEHKDFAAFHFLQWFVEEQMEEERLFRSILDIIKIAGKDDKALLLIDNEIARVRAVEGKS